MRRRIVVLMGLLACGQGFTQETATDPGGTMPEELTTLDLPAHFEWQGSTPKRSRGETTGVTARFHTPLDPDGAREVVDAAFRNAGWTIDELMQFQRAPFSFPDLPRSGRACLAERMISFNAARRQGITEVTFSVPAGTSRASCSFTPEDPRYGDLYRELPSLNAPRSPRTDGYAKPGAGGGFFNSTAYRSGIWIRHNGSLEEVAGGFAAEMSAQGWSRNASWAGMRTAGSSWTKRVAGTPLIYASLQVTDSIEDAGDGDFVISFHAFQLASPTASDAENGMDPETVTRQIFNGMEAEMPPVDHEGPADDPGIRVPPDFEWVGNAKSGVPGAAKATAFRTSLPLLRARRTLLESLIEAGWRHESSSEQSEAFLIQDRARYDRLCRDQETAGLRVQDIDGIRYATIHLSGVIRTTRGCYGSQVVDRNLEPPSRSSMLGEYVPRLELPDSTKAAPGHHRVNGLSNGTMLFNAVRIRSSDIPASIAQHLAPQLSALGWEREVTWEGEQSAGSTWLLRAGGKSSVWGELEIVDLGAGLLDVRFDLKAER